MRKSLLSFLLLMLCVVCAVANPVTPEQAQQKAKAFLAKRGMAASATLDLAYQGKQQAHQNGAPAKDACYYVFNNGHNAGFVIVAGDDCAEDVLGYATDGSFDADNIPENMQAFLQGYAEEIAAARALGANNANSGDENVEVARKVVAPLIETHWNQHDPYNLLCVNNSGQLCVTGCVATALAQVMYYYQWPKSATTEIPAYDSRYGDHYDALPSTTFDWAKMKPVYMNSGNDDNESRMAVAKLMRYCGQAVTMNYSPGASGGYQSSIPDALKNYFGYPGKPSWQRRSKYTTEEWDELIYKELKYGRPVLYGASTSAGSGHEFICDGYDGHGLYHINWGWGGLSDGYFRLSALRPADQSTGGSGGYGGYSLSHDAIIGMSGTEITNEESAEAKSPLRTVELSVDKSTMTYNSSYGFYGLTAYFSYSLSGTQNVIDRGFGLYQDGQLLQKIISETNEELISSYTYGTGGGLFSGLGKNLADGTYQIKGISRVSGTEDWLLNEGSDLIYVEVEISNGQATFTNVEKTLTTALEVTSIEQRFDEGSNVTQIRAYVKNLGEGDVSGSLHLLVNDTWVAQEGLYVSKGGEDFIDFFFQPMTGSVKVVVAENPDGSNPIYENTITLAESGGTHPALAKVDDIKVSCIDGNKMYGALFEGKIKLKNETGADFEGNLELDVDVIVKRTGNGYSWTPYERKVPVSIKAGVTKDVTVAFTGLAIGDEFRYRLYDPSGALLASGGFYNVVPGVVYWKGNGERFAVAPTDKITVPDGVTAVSFEDIDLGDYEVDLSENSNINTIYYVSADNEAEANKISASNIVIGDQARGMLLFEDYDFFVPKRFFVKEARYSYLPELGADGKNGWQTITLPFTVEKVLSGNKEVDWYHGNDTEEKDFWVREFKQVNGNTVKFANVEVWVPNVPYIFAVPGDHWGSEYDLTGKVLEFNATNVWVEKSTVSAVVSDSYEFIGVTGGTIYTSRDEEYAGMMARMENAYVLNENGNAFVQGTTEWQGKHNLCYFTINERTIDPPARLNIGTFDETDGICMPQVTATDGQQVDVYTVDGLKVATATVNGGKVDLGRLPKGVYIVEGKKIVK